jgi:hypothetical protein
MKSSSLLALTASALALPGVAPSTRADAPPTSSSIAYRISNYKEDSLPAEYLLAGSSDRYDITIHQFQLLTPVGENHALTLNSSVESMSGASPWYAVATADGDKSIVMSGATIHEERRDYNLGLRRYLDNGSLGFSLGVSQENDYESQSVGVDVERHFNNNLTTLAGGISYSSDDINPSDAILFNRVNDESKSTSSAYFSLSQIINRNTLYQSSLNITSHNGYLSDPYKLQDRRPDSRMQISWSNSYRHYIPEFEGVLHLDLRLYHDDFGINSLTFETAWYKDLGDFFKIAPRIRYYSQSTADFFTPANDFSGIQIFNSSDYRLAGYGAISGAMQVNAVVNEVTVSFVIERYLTDGSYSFYDSSTSPALVNFTRMTLGFEYSF